MTERDSKTTEREGPGARHGAESTRGGPLAERLRSERYDEIYVSPHLDDVVYSCAGRIAQQRRAGKRVLVVTLFGDGAREPLSNLTGRFADFQARREEDRAALGRLDADYVWFNHPDFVFRRPSPGDLLRIALPFLRLPASELQRAIARELLELCERRLAERGQVLFPLAIGFHPDHRLTFDVGRALHACGRFAVEFYEDIPYALFPVMVALRLRYLGLPAPISLIRGAREMNDGLFRFFGLPWLTFLPTLLYLLALLGAQRLLRIQDRLRGEPPPTRLPDRQIDDVIENKVAAVRLYPTQTELFLAMDDRLYALLRAGAGGYLERSWRFPAFLQPSERVRKLGLAAAGARPEQATGPVPRM
jgi:LmbE family N-acetylglucosaminyl deacetylase